MRLHCFCIGTVIGTCVYVRPRIYLIYDFFAMLRKRAALYVAPIFFIVGWPLGEHHLYHSLPSVPFAPITLRTRLQSSFSLLPLKALNHQCYFALCYKKKTIALFKANISEAKFKYYPNTYTPVYRRIKTNMEIPWIFTPSVCKNKTVSANIAGLQ